MSFLLVSMYFSMFSHCQCCFSVVWPRSLSCCCHSDSFLVGWSLRSFLNQTVSGRLSTINGSRLSLRPRKETRPDRVRHCFLLHTFPLALLWCTGKSLRLFSKFKMCRVRRHAVNYPQTVKKSVGIGLRGRRVRIRRNLGTSCTTRGETWSVVKTENSEWTDWLWLFQQEKHRCLEQTDARLIVTHELFWTHVKFFFDKTSVGVSEPKLKNK